MTATQNPQELKFADYANYHSGNFAVRSGHDSYSVNPMEFRQGDFEAIFFKQNKAYFGKSLGVFTSKELAIAACNAHFSQANS